MSYELRTPLNSILGFSELLKSGTAGKLKVRQREYVDAILTASHTLRDLINDILDLSQLEAGAMELDLEQLDLYELLASVIAADVRTMRARSAVGIVLECREDAGRFVADRRRISQVLLNLISNALKYTPRGGTITLGGEIAGNDVKISVADTGPGVPPEVMPSAFERFASKSGGGGRGGAGLGLALGQPLRRAAQWLGGTGVDGGRGHKGDVPPAAPRRAQRQSAT